MRNVQAGEQRRRCQLSCQLSHRAQFLLTLNLAMMISLIASVIQIKYPYRRRIRMHYVGSALHVVQECLYCK